MYGSAKTEKGALGRLPMASELIDQCQQTVEESRRWREADRSSIGSPITAQSNISTSDQNTLPRSKSPPKLNSHGPGVAGNK